MVTYEMIGVADQNNETYESKYGTYNAKDRFRFNKEAAELVDKKGYRELFDKLVHENLWKLKTEPVKEMSLEDIEKELGYRVRITDPEPNKKVVSEQRRKEVDNTIKFLKHFLGIDLRAEDYY